MTAESPRPSVRLVLGAGCLYAIAAVLLTWPLVLHLGDHLVGHANPAGAADSPLNAYLLRWGLHALTHDPLRLFQANIFYPAPDALAFSDTLLGTQPLFAPLFVLTGSTVLAFNLTLLGAFVVNGLAAAALAWFLLGRPGPALLAGFVYAFALPRFAHLIHLQLLSAWWIPLAILAVEAWLRRPRPVFAAGAAVLIWCQFLSSAYLGLMLGLLLAPYLAWRLAPAWRTLTRRHLAHLGLALLVGAALLWPVARPYLRSQAQWGHQRGLADLVRYSAAPESFLAADAGNRLYGGLAERFRRRDVPWESALFFGVVPLALGAVGFAARRHLPAGWKAAAGAQAAMGLAALLLSLGPLLIRNDAPAQWPLPYLGLFLGLPGLAGIRAPARFALLALLPLALLAGAGLARLIDLARSRWPDRRAAGALLSSLAIAAAGLEALHLPIPLQPVPLAPDPATVRLAERAADGAVLEIPFSLYEPQFDMAYALRSTLHWAPLVNGYSGFRPGSYYEIAALVNGEGLTQRVVEALQALGVRTIVVHLGALAGPERARWQGERPPVPGLEPILALPHLRMYHLAPGPRRAARLAARALLPEQVPASRPLRLRLRLLAPSDAPWINPGPLGIRPVRVGWSPVAGGPSREESVPAYLPTLLPAGGELPLVLATETPDVPGVYRLEIEADAFTLVHQLRVSAEAPSDGPPRAEVAWLGPPEIRVGVSRPVPVAVGVRNAGADPWQEQAAGLARGARVRRLFRLGGLALWWASVELPELGGEWPIWGAGEGTLWLTAPQSYFGRFVLRGRWLRDGKAVSTDLVPLAHDLFPDQTIPVTGIVPAPPSPGRYELELMVWGPDLRPLAHAGGPVRVAVTVEGGAPHH